MLSVARGGKLVFEGTGHIGNGSKLIVRDNATMTLGDNFAISASSTIICYHRITFGRDIQFSWDCLVMDSDTHRIYAEDGTLINPNKEIVFGDKIWIGNQVTVLKGTKVPSNCVIGAGSLVSGSKFEENWILAGSPARMIKKIGSWEI